MSGAKDAKKPEAASGAQQHQQQTGEGQQYGEGNYKATRQYNEGVKDHMRNHDVEREARDAAPKSESEARDMERAEAEGRSRAKADSKDMPEDPGKERE